VIGVITYDHPHRKTYDTLCLLKARGYNDVCVILIPWTERKGFVPLYKHRPENTFLDPELVVRSFQYFVYDIDNMPICDMYLIAGAGILGEPYSTNGKTINAHPGYLPNVRGLDALKWAIYEGQPIGVSTHIIDEKPDAGKILDRDYVPIYSNDTFHALAQRQYEMEIKMLVDAVERFKNKYFVYEPCEDDLERYHSHMRMPKNKEIHLLSKFQKLVEKSC